MTDLPMPRSKRHHYLPQFYLRGFCRNNTLWIYDRKKNEFRKQTPINTAVQSNYYSFEGEDGKTNTDIEMMFSQLEDSSKIMIDKIMARKPLSIEDKSMTS